jgi:hypothetical protein
MLPKMKKMSKTSKAAVPEKIAKTDKVIKVAKPAPSAKVAKANKPVKAARPVKAVKVAKLDIPIDATDAVEKSKAAKPAKMDMTHLKRLPAGQRIYIRRLKQTARQNGTVYRSMIARQPQAKKAEK